MGIGVRIGAACAALSAIIVAARMCSGDAGAASVQGVRSDAADVAPAAASPVEAAPRSGAGLVVRVLSAGGGGPIVGVRVRAVALFDGTCGRRHPPVETDASGVARFEGLPPGPVRIMAGNVARTHVVEAARWDEAVLRIEDGLAREDSDTPCATDPGSEDASFPAAVGGCVRTPAGEGIPFVRVAARPGDAPRDVACAMTGADGRFRLDAVPAGRLRLSAAYIAGAPVVATCVAERGAVLEWNPVIDGGRVLRGRLVGDAGMPRAFASVRAVTLDGTWRAETLCDAEGRFAIPDSPEAPAWIAVEVPGWAGFAPLGLRPGPDVGTIAVSAAARPSAFATGIARGPDGLDLVGAAVSVLPTGSGDDDRVLARVGDGGRFLVGPVTPGPAVIAVAGPGGVWSRVAEVDLAADAASDIGVVRMGRPGFVRLRCVGKGAPVRFVILERPSRRLVGRLRPVSGFAVAGPLPAGPYWLSPGGLCAEREFEIAEGETTALAWTADGAATPAPR